MARKRSRRSKEKESTNNENASLLVTFNVGGNKYQVSRLLLDQHPDTMLSRMVSDTWQTEEGEAKNGFFIERNGARFAYVLDYMRDGRVSLPGGNSVCTKSSLLSELTYFGFENVDSDLIEIEFSHVDATKYVARLTEDFERERHDLVESRDKLNVEIACLVMAHGICVRRLKSESKDIEFLIAKPDKNATESYEDRPYEKTGNELDFQVVNAVNATSLSYQTTALNKALLKYGLEVSNYHEEGAGPDAYYSGISRYNQDREMVKGIIYVGMTVNSLT